MPQIDLIATIEVRPDVLGVAAALLLEYGEAVRDEPGNLRFEALSLIAERITHAPTSRTPCADTSRGKTTVCSRTLRSRATAPEGNDPSLEAEATLLDGVALTIVRRSNKL